MTAPAVIFDLDGTLIDSAPAIHRVANAALAEMGFAPLTCAEVQGFVGKGVPHLVRQLLAASGADPEAPLFDRLERAFMARYETGVEGNAPYPGVAAALEALAAFGCRLAVCTNKPHRAAEAALRHVGLRGRFDLLVGGDSLPTRKPDPAMLHHTHAGLGGGRMIYVGDSEIDAETAANAAAPFALFTEGYRRTPVEGLAHDVAFSDFAHLPGVVREFRW